jgi:hypothetical protein
MGKFKMKIPVASVLILNIGTCLSRQLAGLKFGFLMFICPAMWRD